MRFVSSVIILVLCVLTVERGWNLAGFAAAEARVITRGGDVEALRHWAGIPGLGGPTLAALVARGGRIGSPEASETQADDIARLLSVRPLASAEWLALAAVRLEAGKPAPQVEAALTMSWLTGPNEAAIMWRRAVFGILHWETLSLNAHNRIVSDLAGSVLGHAASGEDLALAGRLLGRQQPAMRLTVAEKLRAAGVSEADLERLGLAGTLG